MNPTLMVAWKPCYLEGEGWYYRSIGKLLSGPFVTFDAAQRAAKKQQATGGQFKIELAREQQRARRLREKNRKENMGVGL